MKVMLVDDEKSLCTALGLILSEAGYDYCCAHDGISALKRFDTERPDLVILDIMMPGMDGFELCRNLRKRNQDLPMLMLSAKGELSDKRNGFGAGVDDYLVKPFAEEELLLRIEALLRRSARTKPADNGPSLLRIDELEVDFTRCEVLLRGRPVPLTAKEFRIVELLAKAPGKVFTRDDIIKDLWGSDYDATSVSIPVYIRRIRQKIEDDPSNPRYLQTVWRFGYRLGD